MQTQDSVLQQKYVEYQFLERSVKQLQAQIHQLDQQVADLNEVAQTVLDLADIKPGTTVLLPISTGLFFEGKLEDAKNLYVNVGSGTMIKKPFKQTYSDLQEQVVSMAALQQELRKKLDELSRQVMRSEEELKTLIGEKDV